LTRKNITYSGNKGQNLKGTIYKKSIHEYLKNDTTPRSHSLKLRLLKEGIKQYICEGCQNIEWRGKPIPLELHHVNGDRYNNELSNLNLLCPNCHAQCENNSGACLRKKV